jgi:hypothetical protein
VLERLVEPAAMTMPRHRADAAASGTRGGRAGRGRGHRGAPALRRRGALSGSGSSRTARRGCAAPAGGSPSRRSRRGRRGRPAASGTNRAAASRVRGRPGGPGPWSHSRADRARSAVASGVTSFWTSSMPRPSRAWPPAAWRLSGPPPRASVRAASLRDVPGRHSSGARG